MAKTTSKSKKNIDAIEKEIMSTPIKEPNPASLAGAQAESLAQAGTVEVSQKPPVPIEGTNSFGSDYTMEVIADNEPGADIFRIPVKDPGMEYRFIRDTKENMSVKTSNLLLMKGGWQIVPTNHLVKTNKIDKTLLHADGSYRVGELVLCFMPQVLFQKKMAEDRRKTNAAMAGVKRLVEGGDPSKGVVHDSMKGIQAGRMDGGRVVFDRSAGKVEYETQK